MHVVQETIAVLNVYICFLHKTLDMLDSLDQN